MMALLRRCLEELRAKRDEAPVSGFALNAVGRFAQSLSPEGQRVVTIPRLVEGRAIIRAVLLSQTDEALIVMPMLEDRPLRSTAQVIDRAAVKGIGGL